MDKAMIAVLNKCFCCNRELEITECETPYQAVVCHTTGNYGSTVYDPAPEITGSNDRVEFVVCDWCFVEKRDRMNVIGKEPAPAVYEKESAE